MDKKNGEKWGMECEWGCGIVMETGAEEQSGWRMTVKGKVCWAIITDRVEKKNKVWKGQGILRAQKTEDTFLETALKETMQIKKKKTKNKTKKKTKQENIAKQENEQ